MATQAEPISSADRHMQLSVTCVALDALLTSEMPVGLGHSSEPVGSSPRQMPPLLSSVPPRYAQ